MKILKDDKANQTCEVVEPTISEKELYTGRFISLKVMTVEKQKGYSQREIVEHKGSVMVICLNEENEIILNKKYRKSVENFSLEVPSAQLNYNENHIEVIKNKILKEIGFESKNIKSAFSFNPNPRYSSEKVYVYAARVEKTSEIENCDNFEVRKMTYLDLNEIYKNPEIIDGKTIVALNYVKEKIDDLGV